MKNLKEYIVEGIFDIDDNINKIESMDEKVSNEPVIVDSEEKKDEKRKIKFVKFLKEMKLGKYIRGK